MLLRFGLLYKVSNCLPGLQYLFACLVRSGVTSGMELAVATKPAGKTSKRLQAMSSAAPPRTGVGAPRCTLQPDGSWAIMGGFGTRGEPEEGADSTEAGPDVQDATRMTVFTPKSASSAVSCQPDFVHEATVSFQSPQPTPPPSREARASGPGNDTLLPSLTEQPPSPKSPGQAIVDRYRAGIASRVPNIVDRIQMEVAAGKELQHMVRIHLCY